MRLIPKNRLTQNSGQVSVARWKEKNGPSEEIGICHQPPLKIGTGEQFVHPYQMQIGIPLCELRESIFKSAARE